MKHMNHELYKSLLKKKTVEQLRFIIKDAQAAANAHPQGENCGYYLDEVNYASMELAKREATYKKRRYSCSRPLT